MKILHLITSLSHGGAQKTLLQLSFFDTDNDHVIISLLPSFSFSHWTIPNHVQIHLLDIKSNPIHTISQILKFIRLDQPDVIQSWLYHADFLTILLKPFVSPPIFWNIRHTNFSFTTDKFSTIFLLPILSFFSWLVPHKIISCSYAGIFVHQKLLYSPKKFTYLPNAVDTSLFYPSVSFSFSERVSSLSQSGLVLGFAGRYHPQKDFSTLFRTLNILKTVYQLDFHIILAGSGLTHHNQSLYKLIRNYSLSENVSLLGPLNYDDIRSFMSFIDIFVLSSSHGEGFPNVLLESLACATPCVTTKSGDSHLVISDSCCAVDVSSPYQLALAILDMSRHLLSLSNTEYSEFSFDLINHVNSAYSLSSMCSSYRSSWRLL